MGFRSSIKRLFFAASLSVSSFASAQPDGKEPSAPKEETKAPKEETKAPKEEIKAQAAPEQAEANQAETANESENAPAPEPAKGPDLAAIHTELASVLDELIEARTRVSVLQKALFKTSLDVSVVRRADDQRLRHITLRLDGVPVHDSDGAAVVKGEARLFQGFAAPGTHELAIEVSEEAKANENYRYTRSERFRFEIKKGTRTKVEIVLRDASDMAEELPQGDDGEYDVRTLVRIEAEKIEGR